MKTGSICTSLLALLLLTACGTTELIPAPPEIIRIPVYKKVFPPAECFEACARYPMPTAETFWDELPFYVKTKDLEQKFCNERQAECARWLVEVEDSD